MTLHFMTIVIRVFVVLGVLYVLGMMLEYFLFD